MFVSSKMIVSTLVFFVASTSALLKPKYRWGEYVQLCSSNLSDLVRAICPSDYNYEPTTESGRYKRELRKIGINYECCQSICTPIHILNNYCQHPQGVDTSHDLVIHLNKPPIPIPITTQTPTTQAPITTGILATTRRPEYKPLTMVMYCYMGIKQYCDPGVQQLASDVAAAIGSVVKHKQ